MMYDSALVIGMGLIGSSIARVLKEKQLSKKIFAIEKNNDVISISNDLNLVDAIENDLNKYNQQFDIIFICTPLPLLSPGSWGLGVQRLEC